MTPACRSCRYFDNDPLMLERTFKGINVLSSVHGSTRGDSGICSLHDRYLMPCHSCPDYEAGGHIQSSVLKSTV